MLGHTTLDMVRRYVNLDTDEVKRQHAQASPVDRLVVGPRVGILLPWPVADRLEELACRQQTIAGSYNYHRLHGELDWQTPAGRQHAALDSAAGRRR